MQWQEWLSSKLLTVSPHLFHMMNFFFFFVRSRDYRLCLVLVVHRGHVFCAAFQCGHRYVPDDFRDTEY